MSDQDYPLPPATFEFLVLSLRTQTEMHLGLFYSGEEQDQDQPEPDFRIARHSIDLLSMLQDKTRGNITVEEQRLIENTVTELRFRYVQAMEHQKAKASPPTPPAPSQPPKGGRTSDRIEPDAPTGEPKSGRTSDHMEPEEQAGS